MRSALGAGGGRLAHQRSSQHDPTSYPAAQIVEAGFRIQGQPIDNGIEALGAFPGAAAFHLRLQPGKSSERSLTALAQPLCCLVIARQQSALIAKPGSDHAVHRSVCGCRHRLFQRRDAQPFLARQLAPLKRLLAGRGVPTRLQIGVTADQANAFLWLNDQLDLIEHGHRAKSQIALAKMNERHNSGQKSAA